MGFMARDLWLHDGSPGRPPLPPPPHKFSGVAHKASPPQHLTLACFLPSGCIYRGAGAALGSGKRCLHPHLSAARRPRVRSRGGARSLWHTFLTAAAQIKQNNNNNNNNKNINSAFLTHLVSQRDICCAQAACFYANPRGTPCATLFLQL